MHYDKFSATLLLQQNLILDVSAQNIKTFIFLLHCAINSCLNDAVYNNNNNTKIWIYETEDFFFCSRIECRDIIQNEILVELVWSVFGELYNLP
jgi:hypothetical protein